jgi:predicted RNA-binding Zn ribbon-like protein
MSAPSYLGPLRDEPIAIELHNTLYATAEGPTDGLAEPASACSFLDALAARGGLALGAASSGAIDLDTLREGREVIRAVLRAEAEGAPHDPAAVGQLNALAAAAPTSPHAELSADRKTLRDTSDRHGAAPTAIVLSTFAADAIRLLTGSIRQQLHACRAPGCVLLYLAKDPRRQWCSKTCGNRARQARHYRRTRQRP